MFDALYIRLMGRPFCFRGNEKQNSLSVESTPLKRGLTYEGLSIVY